MWRYWWRMPHSELTDRSIGEVVNMLVIGQNNLSDVIFHAIRLSIVQCKKNCHSSNVKHVVCIIFKERVWYCWDVNPVLKKVKHWCAVCCAPPIETDKCISFIMLLNALRVFVCACACVNECVWMFRRRLFNRFHSLLKLTIHAVIIVTVVEIRLCSIQCSVRFTT